MDTRNTHSWRALGRRTQDMGRCSKEPVAGSAGWTAGRKVFRHFATAANECLIGRVPPGCHVGLACHVEPDAGSPVKCVVGSGPSGVVGVSRAVFGATSSPCHVYKANYQPSSTPPGATRSLLSPPSPLRSSTAPLPLRASLRRPRSRTTTSRRRRRTRTRRG